MDNREAIRNGLVPCETDPKTGGLSRTGDTFHAEATFTVGSQKNNKRHVCEDCYRYFHRHQKTQLGVAWD